MQTINRSETRFNLGAGQMLKLPRMPRVKITCRAGEIWITEGGVGKDVILAYGSTCTSQGKGDVIAYAHEPSGFDALRFPSVIARLAEYPGQYANAWARRWRFPRHESGVGEGRNYAVTSQS
ncbi:MAG: DUF2917 domain-containing protein [Burkholderiales bacterium]